MRWRGTNRPGFLRWSTLTIVVAALALAACAPDENGPAEEPETGEAEEADDQPAAEGEFELVLGHATIDDAQDELANVFVDEVARLSDGRISGVVHNGGALGDNEEMNRNVRSGVQHAIIQPTGFMAPYAAVFGALDMPFLFPDDETQHAVLNEEAPQQLIDAAREVGLEVVTWAPGGFKNLSTTFPVERLEDLQDRSFRVIQSPELSGQFESWGAVGHGMGLGEVYSALEHGVIEGLENPPDVIYNFRFHEVAPYYTLTGHGALSTVIAVNLEWLESLPSDLQDVVYEAGSNAADVALEIYQAQQEESLASLREEAEVVELPAEEIQRFKAATEAAWDQIMEDEAKAEILTSLQASIEARQ